MLTRLNIQGFKSLLNVEIRFGPFTCIAGANGAGKSNLFDAILFLSDLANHTIVEAAHRVRDRNGGKQGDLRSLFTTKPDGSIGNIRLEADMIVPEEVTDDFGRSAAPATTFLRYKIELKYSETSEFSEKIELLSEELTYIPRSTAKKVIGFPVSREFATSAFKGRKTTPYITTEKSEEGSTIKISQDGNQGRPSQIPAKNSPRTVLGSANTDERPTILAAKREMQSWMLLQLEPTQLRAPDEFSSDSQITHDGAHIPATLERIDRFEEISNRIATLLPEVKAISVDVDNTRRLKTLVLEQRSGVKHKARALSDGTLRFIALAALAFDPKAKGLICLEEPENGIHPSRIGAILQLLREMAIDISQGIDSFNPLRQIIVNTHSPIVVRNLTPDEIIIAVPIQKGKATYTAFGALPNSWRLLGSDPNSELTPKVSLVELLDYLHSSETTTVSEFRHSPLWQLAAEQGTFGFVDDCEDRR
jgi:predicted ATPase